MANGMRIPTTADLMSMWNASGLKEKLIFTFCMLVLFRLGIHLPLFGINNEHFANLASQNNILGFLDLFSGGENPLGLIPPLVNLLAASVKL